MGKHSMTGSDLPRGYDGEPPVCSAKGCGEAATWVLAWNNPKLHAPDRRKTWVACDGHRESLAAFLDARGFLRATVTLAEWRRIEAEPGSPAEPDRPGRHRGPA